MMLPKFTCLTPDYFVSDVLVPYALTHTPLYVVRKPLNGKWLAIAGDDDIVLGWFETRERAINACHSDFRTLPVERGGLGQSYGMAVTR